VQATIHVSPEVRDAVAIGRPVVALETSVLAHGLPPPANLTAARRCAAAVAAAGAVPAFIAVIHGRIVVGAGDGDLERLADPATRAAKAGARDLAPLVLGRRDAGTTVSATCAIAARCDIRVFATGGIGGVHRAGPGDAGASRDVSADLREIASSPVCVVASGPKVILDVTATAEVLETLGVPVIGWRTSELPAFYVAGSGVALEHRVESASEMASLLRVHWGAMNRRGGVLVCVAPPHPLPRDEVEAAVAGALAEARDRQLCGKALTPFLLQAVDRATGGDSRAANVSLLESNARVAAEIAVSLAEAT
jgi:pseudouridine-5'-phosphate glycosidase